MPAVIQLMGSARMDQFFRHPDPSPETLAIRNEKTAENQQESILQSKRNDMEDEIRRLLDEEFKALKFRQKGYLAAYWTDCWGYSDARVGERLYLKDGGVRRSKNLALSLHRCGDPPGVCHGTPDCAHQHGEALWNTIVGRVGGQLEQED